MDAVQNQRQEDDQRGVKQGQQFDKILRALEKQSTPIQAGDKTTPKLGLPAKGLHECPERLLITISNNPRRNFLQYVLIQERVELLEGSNRHVVCERDWPRISERSYRQSARRPPTFAVLVFGGSRFLRFRPGSGPVVQLFTGQVRRP